MKGNIITSVQGTKIIVRYGLKVLLKQHHEIKGIINRIINRRQ